MTTKIKSGVISDNAITSAHISSGAISSAHLTSIDTDSITEGSSNLYFTTARARTSFSITDSGGDGSLAYDNSTGVITYTGPSASEVRAHLSAGTGVTYSGGEISIGQSVATSASPTFANLTLTGNLNITGDVDSVSVTDLDVTDKTITVGVGGTASANDGAGIVVDGASASILWDNSNTSWDFNQNLEIASGKNIRVNTVAPTFVETPMVKNFFKNKKFKKLALDNIPLGKAATESDIATTVCFLASSASSMITGTSIVIDGGWTAQ